MGGPGEPDEIAEAVLFLLSDAASYITARCSMSRARAERLRRLVFDTPAPMIPADFRFTDNSNVFEGEENGCGSTRA